MRRNHIAGTTAVVCITALLGLSGCAHHWTFVTEGNTTKYFFDPGSIVPVSETVWDVKERFLDINTNRWYLETDVRYDCVERTFMTLTTRGFAEHRPLRRTSEIQGNEPVKVVSGTQEEARLNAICAHIRG